MRKFNLSISIPFEILPNIYSNGLGSFRSRNTEIKGKQVGSFSWVDYLRNSSGHCLGNAGLTK